MREQDCGCVPVVTDQESKKMVGVVTDRDIAMRAVAEGKPPETPVSELMSDEVSCCGPNDNVKKAREIMEERQVRRVPVIDDGGCCVGMISQADLAREGSAGQRQEGGPHGRADLGADRRRDKYLTNIPFVFAATAKLYYAHWGEFFHLAIFEQGDDPADWDSAFERTHQRYFAALKGAEAGRILELACGGGAFAVSRNARTAGASPSARPRIRIDDLSAGAGRRRSSP